MGDRVAIVGARAHPRLDLVREYVRTLPPDTVVISGGAEGVDRAALQAADDAGLAWCEYRPSAVDGSEEVKVLCQERRPPKRPSLALPMMLHRSWRDALMMRNTMIVNECTRLVAFPDGSKGGTHDTIREAHRFRRPVELRYVDGRVVVPGTRKRTFDEGRGEAARIVRSRR